MSVVFEGVDMPTACCFVDGEHSVFAHMEYCRFYNICKQRDTVKNNYKPDDCPVILLKQEPTTKNDLGVDLVSRADVLKLMQDNWHSHNGDWAMQESMDDIRALPSVTPQEPCDKCEVGNPCLYCKHEFEPQESADKHISGKADRSVEDADSN